ncbi:unnamed protein product, partial [Mesorhabditis belari]|uniref:L-type lectin-like domain-containing protein n=1 Tax=Mesorhabditis belari TaxID=2138241 RepID=A0AAF3F0B8_9BILA
MKSLLLCCLTAHLYLGLNAEGNPPIVGSHVDEERGFSIRDFELKPPFPNLYTGWDSTGDAVMINNRISLTRDQRSMRGTLWSRNRIQERDWEAQASIRIYGSSGKLHAEGIALWYLADPALPGPVFGVNENFKGIGIFFDTYKNDVNNHDAYPRISVVLNDGTKTLDWDKDGENLRLGDCHIAGGAQSPDSDARSNKVFRILIRYYMENLEIYYAQYEDFKWTQCTTISDVRLPTNYIFGMSASTGDLTNNHELATFKVSALDAPPHSSFPAMIPEHKAVKESAPIVEESQGWGWGMKIFFFILALVFSILLIESIQLSRWGQKRRYYIVSTDERIM